MSAYDAEYRSKLTTPETAVSKIASATNISMGMALGEPPALLRALAARLKAGELKDLSLWYFHSMPAAGETVLRYENLERVRPHCMFLGLYERELIKRGEKEGRKLVNFVPMAFSEAPRLLTERVEIDTFITTVSPMDKHGWFTFGTNNDYASTVAKSAKRLMVEVNRNMPRVFGDSFLHISDVDIIVENDEPLFEVPIPPAQPQDEIIGRGIAEMVEDGACLQMGIGALPNAVCTLLKDHQNLGIHTELLMPGFVDLLLSGAVTNRSKATYPGRTVFTFAVGDRKLYDLLDDNPSMASLPVGIVNDPRHIAKNRKVVSVNATLEVDLTGACNSEHMMGRQYSGSGGQLDFVRGAYASPGGKSIIACHSTAKGETLSRIVAELKGPVTCPRNDTQYVMTEFGCVDLKGKSASERAKALIGIAHPKFHGELTEAARKKMLI
ncbi:MAG: acetyl-CoA hydrolase/transferase C-terminal domain-containing protein [Alphaproteobacteria bacterium]